MLSVFNQVFKLEKKFEFKKIFRVLYWFILVLCVFEAVGTLLYFVPLIGDLATMGFFRFYKILLACNALLLVMAIVYLCSRKTKKYVIHAVISVISVAVFVFLSVFIPSNINSQGEKISFAKVFSSSDFSEVKEYSTVYTSEPEKCELSVFYTDDEKNDKPVIFYAHGGGWILGSRYDRLHITKQLAKNGFVVVCADYSLSTQENNYWNFTEKQLLKAVEWTDINIRNYGGSTKRFYMVGDSAGGNLALNLAYKINSGEYKNMPKVNAVSVIYPVTSVEDFYNMGNFVTKPTAQKMAAFYTGGSPKEYPERYSAVNPAEYISKTTPPTLITLGTGDTSVNPKSTYAFDKKLEQNGVETALIKVPFANHVGDSEDNNFMSQAYVNNTVKWFNTH